MYGSIGPALKSETVDYSSPPYIPSFIPDSIGATGAGTVTGKLLLDTVDRVHAVSVGMNPLRFKSITTATATGLIVYTGDNSPRAIA